MSKLRIATIVLDGMPFIAWHLPVFNMLRLDWEWHIAEGTAKPVADTDWCAEIEPRLSHDGTTEYLDAISCHPRVTIHRRKSWRGKTEQINACLNNLKDGDIVMQIDADELWTARQIETVMKMFTIEPEVNAMSFWMRYYVGPHIVITSRDQYGNYGNREWRRAWRLNSDSFRFVTHEPPEVNQPCKWMKNDATESVGLVPHHYAYATKKQVAFKSRYYKYPNAVREWERLQANTTWPCKLGSFLSWVKDDAIADLLYR